MWTASSANLTTADSASAVEYRATDLMPSSRQARATRRAISPRLAIRTFSNKLAPQAAVSRRFEVHEYLLELDPVAVAGRDLDDLSGLTGNDLVHHLHRLDYAHPLSLLDRVADLD